MFDPAALGTLRIGLDAIQADADRGPAMIRRRAPRKAPHGHRPGIRAALAGILRRIADALEPRPGQGMPA